MPLSRPSLPLHAALLRRSVRALNASRQHCWHCHRTPLVGEQAHLYGERLVCELCRARRSEPPERSLVVRSPEGARAVRLRPALPS